MASGIANDEQGYDERRFKSPIRSELLCSICQDVLKNPKACEKEHSFCHACILRHLANSHTCPECREHLTPETLKNPPRFLTNYLSDLRIFCDHRSRGCLEDVRLEDLPIHIDQCEFAPVQCERCGIVVNRKDKDQQKCQEHMPQRNFEPRMNNEESSKSEVNTRDVVLKCQECKSIKQNQEKMKVDVARVKEFQGQIKAKQDEMNVELSEIKNQVLAIERKQDDIHAKVTGLTENVNEMKQTLVEMKVDEISLKAEMRQQFQRVTEMLNLFLQGNNANIGDQVFYSFYAANNNPEIIIIGGLSAPDRERVLDTVEIYSIFDGKSTRLPPMNHTRVETASCVFNNDVIVAGGFNGFTCINNIEILKMDHHPLRWTVFEGKLPSGLSSHSMIVYQDKLLVIGGMCSIDNRISNAIHEISLIPPHTTKRLFKMPQARRNHRAELVNNELFVLGGTSTGLSKDAMDSVISYDLIKNERKRCEALAYHVSGMFTVTWGSKIIVIGGTNKNGQVLNDVSMYETVTGKSEKLPSMIYRRSGCSAVILQEVIYVMGGWNQELGYLNSVECLTIGNDFWVELPGLKEKRKLATAVVKPLH